MVGSWISFLGFALGVLITNNGILSGIQESLRTPRLNPAEGPATLASLLGVSPWVVIAAVVFAGGLWLWRGHQKTYQGGWSWLVTGVAIGLIGLIAWPLSSLTGRYFGLSVTEPAYTYMRFLGLGQVSALSWGSFMWVGIPFGAYISARFHGEFKWRAPGPQRILQALGGGVVMGIGAGIAGGCNVGHSWVESACRRVTPDGFLLSPSRQVDSNCP